MLFGQKKRVHGILLLTEDSRCLPLLLPVDVGCVRDDKSMQGWALLSDCCFPQKKTQIPFELVCERDVVPISVSGDTAKQQKNGKDIVNQIGRERRKQAHFMLDPELKKDRAADIIQTLIYGGGATLVLMMIIGLFSSGRLKWPF
ncbi:hypothetical protein CVH13_00270 [Dehalococcoides mccartyi]|jgi:hypothetical protein|uniref:Uncharacterized protein n=2 Tax=Dehalococcoides mccartyi TaxID=61435 RepID=A0A2J1DZZ8_9CHLR|nr:hypothetical protein CVH13_00270 [Dehalococcoides mccartyi]